MKICELEAVVRNVAEFELWHLGYHVWEGREPIVSKIQSRQGHQFR